jgi:hypothetical protein
MVSTVLILECPDTEETLHTYGEFKGIYSPSMLTEIMTIRRRVVSPTLKKYKHGPDVRLAALFIDKGGEFRTIIPVPLDEVQEHYFLRETKKFLSNHNDEKTKYYSDNFSVLYLQYQKRT